MGRKLYQKPERALARRWGRLVVPKECRPAWVKAMEMVERRPGGGVEGLVWKMGLGELVKEFPQGVDAWMKFLKSEMEEDKINEGC